MTREYTEAGLPYPTGSSFVIDGDDDIKALAKELDERVVRVLPSGTHVPGDAPTAWPMGVSTMVGTVATGWPFTCTVVTVRNPNSTRLLQFVAGFTSAAASRVLVRSSDGTTWRPWAAASAPYGDVSGISTVPNIPAGGVASLAVSLPANTFTAAPVLALAMLTTAPNVRAASVSGVSATGFTLYGHNGSGTQQGLAVHWHAQQDTAPSALAAALAADTALAPATVTCHTEGCENADVPIVLDLGYLDDDGTTQHVDAVACGPCGQPITDITEEDQ